MKYNKIKNITFFLFNYNRGGAEWVITNLANEMLEKGFKIEIVSIKGGNMFEELKADIKYLSFNGNILKSLFFLFKTRKRRDVLFTTQRGASVLAYLTTLLVPFKGIRIVREAASNFNSDLENKNFIARIIWRKFFQWTYRSADKIIVNSPGTKQDLFAAKIISSKSKNVFEISNPIDIAKINYKADLKEFHNIKFKEKNIITIGRLVPKKNIDLLIKAFSTICAKGEDVQLIIIGSGPEEEKLRKLVLDLSISQSVTFTGQVSNPYSILKRCDLFILASIWEGFGMVIVEALTLGVPVIASDINSGPQQILENGKYGKLFNPYDSLELSLIIQEELRRSHDKLALIQRSLFFEKTKITSEYLSVILD